MYASCGVLKRWLLPSQRLVVVAYLLQLALLPPRPAEAIECNYDGDCANRDKICHENKCICARDRPIEDQERCLSLSLIGETCALAEQCLGNSLCVDGICSCGNEAISLFNPSSKIFYCHPKRRLNEECNYDSQCPSNSYCSTSKFGCLCQNGFTPATTLSATENAIEGSDCLPVPCNSSSCDSAFHFCEYEKCKCIATHFDPETAKCYKFGSTGGKSADELLLANEANQNLTAVGHGGDDGFYSIMKDLRENSDRMWLVLIVLISLSILLLALIFMLIRKHYLGYCWTAHKKEYQPNTKKQPKNGYFNKNSINNKSFRQKNGETEEDSNDGESVADKSSLVSSGNHNNNNGKKNATTRTPLAGLPASALMTTSKDKSMHHNYVKVNINENHQDTSDSFNGNRQYYLQQQVAASPLKSSTSTPV